MLAFAAVALLNLAAAARAPDRHDQPWDTEQWIRMRLAAGEIADLDLNPACAGEPRPGRDSDAGWDNSCRTIGPAVVRDLLGLEGNSSGTWHDVRLAHVNISGDLDLANADVARELQIENSRIDGDVVLTGAHLARRLSLAGSYVRGNILAQRMKAEDEVSLAAARVTGQITFLWAKVDGLLNLQDAEVKDLLDLNSAHVTRSLFLRRGDFAGDANIIALTVDGNLDLASATFHRSFAATELKIGGVFYASNAVFGSDRPHSQDGTTVDGRFSLSDSRVQGSMVLDRAVFFDDVMLLSLNAGELVLTGSIFHGNMYAGESRIKTDWAMGCDLAPGDATCARTRVGNPIGTEFFGIVDVRNIDVGGVLELAGSTFWESVDLHGMHVGGSVFMNDGAHFAKPVNLQRARIDDSLMLSGSDFTAIDLSSARIGREMRLQGDGTATRWIYDDDQPPRLLLHNAHVDAIVDTELDWPDQLELDLDGFTYTYPPGPDVAQWRKPPHRDSSWWVQWLGHDSKVPAQAYAQLATVLAASGDNAAAGAVSFAGREQERLREWEIGNCSGDPPAVVVDANGAMPPVTNTAFVPWQGSRCLASLGYLVQRSLVGYGLGYRAFWVLAWVFLLWAIGFAVLLSAHESRGKGVRWCGFASLDRMLPIVDLNKAFAEYLAAPDPHNGPRQYQVVYFWIHALLGWILGLLLVAAISGIAQRA